MAIRLVADRVRGAAAEPDSGPRAVDQRSAAGRATVLVDQLSAERATARRGLVDSAGECPSAPPPASTLRPSIIRASGSGPAPEPTIIPSPVSAPTAAADASAAGRRRWPPSHRRAEAIHDDPLDDVAVAFDQPLVDIAERSELRPLSDRMRILVTGGAGYIGSETVRLLIERGHEPIVLDTLERGHRAAVDAAPLIVGSIEDGPLVEATIRERGIEAVIHFAALKSVEESFVDPSRYLTVNVGGSFELFRAMARTGVDRLVYSSSCAVYGTPSDLPVRETSALQPENAYGETKLLVERGLRWLREGGLRAVNLRYFNAAGAALDGRHGEDWTDAPNLVPVVIKATLGYGPPVRILGSDYPTPDGSAIRDYVHVADLADAHVRAVEAVGDGWPMPH